MVEVTRETMREALYWKVNVDVLERAGNKPGRLTANALADAISDALGLLQDEPEALGTVVRADGFLYIATNGTPGTHRWVWVNPERADCSVSALRWKDFGSSKVEVVK